jgi:hypothetical protein
MLSWHNPGSGPDFLRDTLEVRLVNLEAEIKTPAGNFRALEYRYRLPDDITLIENLRGIVSGYLVPGLGLVAIIIRDEKTEEVIRKSLLVSYRIQ